MPGAQKGQAEGEDEEGDDVAAFEGVDELVSRMVLDEQAGDAGEGPTEHEENGGGEHGEDSDADTEEAAEEAEGKRHEDDEEEAGEFLSEDSPGE